MKSKIALVFLLCSVATAPAYAINAHYRDRLVRSGCTEISAGDGSCDINKTKAQNAGQHDKAAQVRDPMREASFSSDTLNATISNGFFSATVNGKTATVKRLNPHFYEVRGSGFVISISLDENGITDASWNKTKGRDHGILQVVQK